MRAICVYCGSNFGNNPDYRDAAERLASALARRGLGLIYGGGSVGLMGALADAARAAGVRVTGVIPRALLDREVGHLGLDHLRVVASMHERKSLMSELADGFIALPGGIGTLEELFEMWTWAQLGIHRKPVGLLNVGGFFDPLLSYLDRATEAGFIRDVHRRVLLVADEPDALLDRFERYHPPDVPKWVDRDET